MKTIQPHNSNRLSCTLGARWLVGLPGVVASGLSPELSLTSGYAGYFSADDPTGNMFTRDTALGRDSKMSSLANKHRPGSTDRQVRLTPGRRTPGQSPILG